MKKLILSTLAALAISASASAVVADRLWVIGEPAGGWDTTLGVELKKTSDGVFEYDADFDGKKSFGFVDRLADPGDWDSFNAHRYVAPSSGTVPEEGENPMEYGTSDYCWDLPAGKYHMTIDTNKMVLILGEGGTGGDDGDDDDKPEVKIPDLFFVGEVNNWSFKDDYRFTADETGKIFTYTAPVIRGTSDCGFKISAKDWNPEFTTENMTMYPGQVYDMKPGKNHGNMAFGQDLIQAELIFDTEAMTLTVNDVTAGIDGVNTVTGLTPVYYTLQGIEVANPGPGLYLERRGTTVRKVYLR